MYTKWRFNFFIMWQTRKMESLFKLNTKTYTRHPSHIIYQGKCNQVVDKHALAKQHATSRFLLMSIQMLISSRYQPH